MLLAGSYNHRGAITYMIHRGPLRSPLLVLLLHFKPPFLNELPFSNVLGVLCCCRTFSFALSFCFLALQLFLTSRFFLLGSPFTFHLTLLLKFTLGFPLILPASQPEQLICKRHASLTCSFFRSAAISAFGLVDADVPELLKLVLEAVDWIEALLGFFATAVCFG